MAPPYMKLYWADYHQDTRHLTRDEHGAYFLLIGEAWNRGGYLPDDDALLARLALASPEEWERLKPIVMAYFRPASKGRWRHKRIAAELASYDEVSRKRKAAGKKGGEASRGKGDENTPANAAAIAEQKTTKPEPEPEPEIGKDADASSVARVATKGAAITEAFDAYNAMAARAGLPRARSMDAARRKAISARLSDGGLELWKEALAAVERSRHCRGENDRHWKADLDFICQPKSWRRLLEGFYGGQAVEAPQVRRAFVGPDWVRELMRQAFEKGDEYLDAYGAWQDLPVKALVVGSAELARMIRDKAIREFEARGATVIAGEPGRAA